MARERRTAPWPRRPPRDPIAAVNQLARELSTAYGDDGTLSLASKLLWLRYGDPVVIYDSRVKRAVKTHTGDFAHYIELWEARWDQEKANIAIACRQLPKAIRYAECDERTSRVSVNRTIQERWFKRRVLDIKLWLEGRPG